MTSAPPTLPLLPWADGLYSLKRHGLSITNCESEPIHIPGCIQAHGAMLVLRLSDLTILQVSENTAEHFGEAPNQLLDQGVSRVLTEAGLVRLQSLLKLGSIDLTPLYIFTLPAMDSRPALDICAHISAGALVLEFELINPMPDKAPGGDKDVFDLVKQAVSRMQKTLALRDFCQSVSDSVRQITSLDRVMIYRFHPDQHGEVFSESKRPDLNGWIGLHYPEGDIPKQAREIFKRIWIRPLPNASGPLIELVPLANPDTGQALDMTYCALRGASVMYSEYLANMGVAASLTMPILVDGELWGLIACHHYKATHFSHQLRGACELLAQVASMQLKAVAHNEELRYRLRLDAVHQQLIARAATTGDLTALSDSQPSLIDAMDADGAALYYLDRWWCTGATPSESQLSELADWLDYRPEFGAVTRPVFATDTLGRIYPKGAEIAAVASGVLAVRVSRLRKDFVIWFRKETIQTVNWAGQPDEKPLIPGPHGQRLTPRGSFELFVESVRERSKPWSSLEIESALRLQLLVMELVVARAERLAELNLDLTRSNEELDAFAYVASHDLKEPLRGIHRYAHHLLLSSQELDSENRQRVDNLMRLTVRMDSLLDSLLHFSRVGRTTLEYEHVDLNEILDEALEMIGTVRVSETSVIEVPRALPEIPGDRVRIREIFSNLVSNSLKYTKQLRPRVEIGFVAPNDDAYQSLLPKGSPLTTVFYVRDNGIGIDQKHFAQVFRMFKRLHSRDDFGGGVGAGLTIVEKLVQRHGGQIWIDSSAEVGTTFYFTLPGNASANP